MTDFRVNPQRMVRNGRRWLTLALKHPALLSSVLATGLVLGVRQAGGLQSLELLAFDQMVRLRPDAGVDSRLLVVAITEDDIRSQNRWPISDQVVAQLLAKLNQYKPKVIGLDLYRDVPQQPGHETLLKQLQSSNVTTVMLLGDADNGSVPPPPGIASDRVGFSDFVVDPDAVVRRNLLFATTESDQYYSFALRLSLQYLADQKRPFRANQNALQIGKAVFPALNPHAGSYQALDDRGYQVLLNYRSSNNVARQVTLTQVLQGELQPEWVKDKLVLIGTTAPSGKDLFLTPYNLSARQQDPKTPGVLIHAQMASQILGHVLDGNSLLWYWSEPGEILWLWLWAMLGSVLAWRFRHPASLVFMITAAAGGLLCICFGILLQAGWVPVVPAAIALIAATAGVVVYRLLHDAFHDALTGLPNRALFMKQLEWIIKHNERFSTWRKRSEAPTIAVLFLGLDSFKAINDSFGHRLGDQLLVATTDRLKTCLHPTDQLARVGGDEFAILRHNVQDPDEVTYLADQLQRQMTLPIKLNGQEVFSTASIGIVLGRSNSDYEPEDILRDAHTAMHRAKASGKARHEVFVTGMRVQVMTRLQLETDLRHAIERQEFRLHYQPLIALQTGKIVGFEALVRWQHPQRGLVPPNDFIPVAEETDLIIPMGQWITHEACRQLRLWQEKFPREQPLIVSVNLSGKQFSQPDLVESIEQALEETGLDGHSLKLEITESMAMTDVESTIALLHRLKALHLQLSIDDFGTGYSSLSYLHRFPTNTIKVDRSFVSRMGDESEDAQIVQTIIILGHNLGMDIVAEGVETAEQLASLRELKCEYGQGFFFSKPLVAEAAEALLNTDPQW
ncbi:MAG: EAL domain-containing protein [Tildeniella nuda ZEHNDER 1965/U140]|jgi:diguanylate cyclase (GGDEF)-like protein|nr:EAL domain-containing protein [Tildeniella nuda ZEHNDER 1965/U140]